MKPWMRRFAGAVALTATQIGTGLAQTVDSSPSCMTITTLGEVHDALTVGSVWANDPGQVRTFASEQNVMILPEALLNDPLFRSKIMDDVAKLVAACVKSQTQS